MKNGDRSAFAGVVQQFQQPLFGYLGRMGLTQSVSEEIAQETFLRAWTKLNDYDPARAEFSTWLFTIARNLALHELDRASNKREVTSDEALPEFASQDKQPAEVFSQHQQRKRLFNALHNLPVADRSALALAYFQELDLAAIARVEGCSVGAIKVRLHRAKQRLRQLLEEHYE
ncbi:MAG: sigma-70 family RNA polymerase sigma factor [Methylococcales bacterium]